jgi:glycosyltransferase involved in cell wall biosynthesis
VRVAVTLEQCWHRVPGGTATAALGLVAALAGRDDVEVVGVAARHGERPPPAFAPAVPVRHLPVPRRVLYETWHTRWPWPPVQQATGPVDVVHGTGVAVPPAGDAPVVMTVNDLAFVHDPSSFTRNGVRFFRRATEAARRRAAVVVVPSEATADDCRAAGFDPARLRVVPWAHEGDAAGPDAVADARRRHRLPERYGLFVGTLEPRKNLRRLVEAWRATGTDVPLVLAGPAGWGDAGMDGADVLPIGFVSATDRDALFAGAAVVAYPSLREGFGLPVLEAMAQGAPVVTSAGTSTQEVAGDAAVLVDPLDVGSIADGLRQVLDDPVAAAELGERARARAATFTWARCADGYVAAYREAVAG